MSSMEGETVLDEGPEVGEREELKCPLPNIASLELFMGVEFI